MELKPVAITEFKGLNDRVDHLGVDPGTLTAVQNMMLTDSSGLKTRDGFVLEDATGGTAFFTRSGKRAFVASGGTIYELLSATEKRQITSGLSGQIHFAEMGDQILVRTPTTVGVIQQAYHQAPESRVGLSIHLETLPETRVGVVPGRYNAVSIPREGKILGPAGPIVTAVVPPTSPYEVTTIMGEEGLLYMTGANSDLFYPVASGAGTSYRHREGAKLGGAPLDPMFFEGTAWPRTGESFIAFLDGRVWITGYEGSDNITYLYPSYPFQLGICDLSRYAPITGRVGLFAEIGGNILIGTDTAIYAFDGKRLNKLADTGVPTHTSYGYTPDGKIWFWTDRGMARYPELEFVTEDAVREVEAQRVAVQRLRDPDGDQMVAMFSETS